MSLDDIKNESAKIEVANKDFAKGKDLIIERFLI